MTSLSLPSSRPRLSSTALRAKIHPFNIDRQRHPIVIVGIRGYYANTMGVPGLNDRGIYDDALFVDTPEATVAYNGNTDPSRIRKGTGKGSRKGMASLKPDVYYAHRIALHRGKYTALCQTCGPVTVVRDGEPNYEDKGYFGINIHRGEFSSTSSLGCQTIHPLQWDSFINLVVDQAKRYFGVVGFRRATIPYVLLDG